MIKKLKITNFKSIKEMDLVCKRVNLFIGRPNVGKTNILESLGLFSASYTNGHFEDLIRFESIANLLYDNDLETNAVISGDDEYKASIQYKKKDSKFHISLIKGSKNFVNFTYGHDGSGGGNFDKNEKSFVKYYKFKSMNVFEKAEPEPLLPPYGSNLLTVLLSNKDLRKRLADILEEYDLELVLRPQEKKIEIEKKEDGIAISHPYSIVSDTLQRVIFHMIAIETNKDSIILFDEPGAYAFPYYTKFLAERIALNEGNQFFISTHNPYFLLSVLQKTQENDITVNITFYRDHQTRIKQLSGNELSQVLDLDVDVFFNLENFLE